MSGGTGADGAARTVRWRAQYTSEELEPTDTPCLFVVRIGDVVHALVAGSDQMATLPMLGQDGGSARESLTEEGHVVFLEGHARRDDPTLDYLDRRYSTGIFRLDLRTHDTTRMPFEPRPGQMARRRLAASRNGHRLLIAEGWSAPHEIPVHATPAERSFLLVDSARTTLTVVDVPGNQAHEVGTFAGSTGGSGDDPGIQWSPDGRFIAMNATVPPLRGEVPTPPVIRVLDTASGDLLDVIPKAQLVGSLAWSPDSSQFLIARFGRVAVHNVLTGTDTALPAFPDYRPEPPGHGKPRVLGFADDQRVFTATERGKVMTIGLTHTQTAQTEPLCRCSGYGCQYPTLAPAPLELWR